MVLQQIVGVGDFGLDDSGANAQEKDAQPPDHRNLPTNRATSTPTPKISTATVSA